MADRATSRWTFQALFVALVAAVLFAQLLPLDLQPGRLPGPDILVLLAFSWVVMRPDYVPVALLAVVFFVADILMMRPLGLWTALVVIGAEFLRIRSVALRDVSIFAEWALVGAVITAMFVVNALVLALFAVVQPGPGLTVIRLGATILAYPLVVILAGRAFGLRKIAPGEVDRLGHRQ